MNELYYVTETSEEGVQTLKGFNLTRKEAVALTMKKEGAGYGCHTTKFKTERKAITELITKPEEFNKALAIIKKAGYCVFPNREITQSYQQQNEL